MLSIEGLISNKKKSKCPQGTAVQSTKVHERVLWETRPLLPTIIGKCFLEENVFNLVMRIEKCGACVVFQYIQPPPAALTFNISTSVRPSALAPQIQLSANAENRR